MATLTQNSIHQATLTKIGDREVRLERVVKASRDRVWRAFTDPPLLARWWGRGHRVEVVRMEVERGGHWRYIESSPDGSDGFEGRYREVIKPERLEQTMEWDGLPGHVLVSTATFEDLGDDTTKVVTSMQFMTTEDREGMLSYGMEGGMNESYQALDAVLAESW